MNPLSAANPLAATWESLWRCETAAEVAALWAPEPAVCTFVPFDAQRILSGREAIVQHLLARRGAQRLSSTKWGDWVSWLDGPISVGFAELQFGLEPRVGHAVVEARRIRFLAAAEGPPDRFRLRHLAEAPPAVLLEVLADYQRHARLPDVSP
jgi:hypothetical protein